MISDRDSPCMQEVNPVQFSTVMSPAGRRYGYLRIGVFSVGTADRVAEALAALPPATSACSADAAPPACRDAAGVAGLVLDLRDNPGGSLAEGIAVAALLEPRQGVFMYVSGRDSPREAVRIVDFEGGTDAVSAAPARPWREPDAPPIVRSPRRAGGCADQHRFCSSGGRQPHSV